jgi:HK97 family phage major capsid protein
MSAPLFVTEKLPALGGVGDLVLFDPKMYCLATRQMELEYGFDQTAYYKNQTIIRAIWRGDGQPLARNTFTAGDDATTVGCYVVLT